MWESLFSIQQVKGPTSKFYVEHIEKKLKMGKQQENIISWYDFIEQAATTQQDRYDSTGWLTRTRSTRPLKKTSFGSDLLRMRTLSAPGWGHPLCTLSGEDWHVARERILFNAPAEYLNELCSRNWHTLGTRLKSTTFSTDSLYSETYRLEDYLHTRCLGGVTWLWFISRHVSSQPSRPGKLIQIFLA